jgi:hypothetical protein
VAARVRAEALARAGLPPVEGEQLFFTSEDVLPLLFESGFRHVRTRPMQEQILDLHGIYDPAHDFLAAWRLAVVSRDASVSPP